MMKSLILLVTLQLLSICILGAKVSQIRNPSIHGIVAMPPGNFDSNVCLPDVYNGDDPRYDGGSFYVQDNEGNGVFVCPQSKDLVTHINYGDKVIVSGRLETDPVNILTILANDIVQITGGKQNQIEIDEKSSFDEFYASDFGDLVAIEGFITQIVVTFGAAGSIFTIQDCDGNTIKGWWTGSIDTSDDFNLNDLFNVEDDGQTDSPTYFRMVGFAENYYPMCWDGESSMEFQPRFVDEIVAMDTPSGCSP